MSTSGRLIKILGLQCSRTDRVVLRREVRMGIVPYVGHYKAKFCIYL